MIAVLCAWNEREGKMNDLMRYNCFSEQCYLKGGRDVAMETNHCGDVGVVVPSHYALLP